MEAWPLTGRAEELGVIAVLFDRDATIEYAGVVVAGRPGVGKTRLAHEAAEQASGEGWAVRWLVGTAAARPIPLGAFAQWVGRLDGSPLQIVGALIAAITDDPQGRPLLVAVDDVHLLDDLSAFVLHQLVLRRAAVVIATLRTGESAPDTVTALWKDGHLHRLDLQPLSRPHTAALLERVLGGTVAPACADRMWSLTRGNVLFLRQMVTQELLADRISPGPTGWEWTALLTVSESLTDLVRDQIGDVPDTVGDVVDLVAVAEPLELELLGRLAEPAAIEDAEERGLIAVARPQPGEVVRVGHPLFAEVRVARAGHIRLAGLRGRVAQAMAAPGQATTVDPVRLALLWQQSDLPPDRDVLSRAAEAAYIRLDLDLAYRLAAAAVRAGAGVDVDVELLSANALRTLSRGPEAEQVLSPLSVRDLPEPTWTTAVVLRAINMLWALGRPERARRLLDDAMARASGAAVHRLAAFQAAQLAVEGRPEDALTVCRSLDSGQLTAIPAVMEAWARTIASGDLGRPAEAAAAADACRVAATSPEAAWFRDVLLAIYHNQALILGGCIPQAAAVADIAYRQCADVPGTAQACGAGISGMSALSRGDLPAAIRMLGEAFTAFVDSTHGAGYHFGIGYVEALARAGEVDTAREVLTVVERDRHPAHAYRHSDCLLAAAWVAAARGLTSQAQTLARDSAEFARARGQHAREVAALQAAIQFGDQHTAARLVELAALTDCLRAPLVARWATALADHNGGDALLDVAHDLEAMGDRIAAADAAAHATLAYRRTGRRGSALTAAAYTARLAAECGAITPATRAAATPVPLSDREREIATLVAAGLTNKQIADRLTLSVRTVEGHIYRCSTRLGMTSRSELAHLMSEITHTRVQD